MGSFLLLLYLGGVGPVISNILAKTASGVFGYFAHRIFTFQTRREESHMRQAGLYVLLLAINVPTTSLMLAGLLYIVPYPELAKLISDVGFVFINFWISKRFVFTGSPQDQVS